MFDESNQFLLEVLENQEKFQHICRSLMSLSINSLNSFLELKVIGAYSSGLGLNSFESCLG